MSLKQFPNFYNIANMLGLKFYGLYPISTWYMTIHCKNCQYEGKCGVDWKKYTLFLLCMIFFIWIFTMFYNTHFSLYSISMHRIRFYTGAFILFLSYLYIFFRPQNFFCPSCRSNYGIPLKFHETLKLK